MDAVDTEVELEVVDDHGQRLFHYETPEGQKILFKYLLPFREMVYETVSVVRNGAEIGSTVAVSLGTHAAFEAFTTDHLKEVFGAQAEYKNREEIRKLPAKPFLAGDKLRFSFRSTQESPFAQTLKEAAVFVGIVLASEGKSVNAPHMNPGQS